METGWDGKDRDMKEWKAGRRMIDYHIKNLQKSTTQEEHETRMYVSL